LVNELLETVRMIIRPTNVEELDIVLIDENILVEVEHVVMSCEACAENAATALDYLLDALTGCDPTVTTYLMRRPVRCPSCFGQIKEKTLVAV
jgi:hypothetical protein